MAGVKSHKKRSESREKAIKSALFLAARDGWARVSMHDIAAHAKIPLPDLHAEFDDKTALLVAYGRMIDKKVLDCVSTSHGSSSHRDRLFDVLMERFDVLNEDRDALLSILESFKCDPRQALTGLPHLGRSMAHMLDAAGIDTSGLQGGAHVAALTVVYLATVRTWMDDDSPDMAKTMAALDKNLGRAEQCATMMGMTNKGA